MAIIAWWYSFVRPKKSKNFDQRGKQGEKRMTEWLSKSTKNNNNLPSSERMSKKYLSLLIRNYNGTGSILTSYMYFTFTSKTLSLSSGLPYIYMYLSPIEDFKIVLNSQKKAENNINK